MQKKLYNLKDCSMQNKHYKEQKQTLRVMTTDHLEGAKPRLLKEEESVVGGDGGVEGWNSSAGQGDHKRKERGDDCSRLQHRSCTGCHVLTRFFDLNVAIVCVAHEVGFAHRSATSFGHAEH